MPNSQDRAPLSIKMSTAPQLLKPSCLKAMQKGYRLTNNIGTCPFEWSELQRGPETAQNPRKKISWITNVLLSFIQATFAVVQCWRSSQNDMETPTHKIYIHFSGVLYTYGVVLHWANFRNREFLPHFVRSYVQFFEDLQS